VRRETVILLVVIVVVAPLAGVATYYVLQSVLVRVTAVAFPGELALDILQPDPYSRLVVEVDWVEGEEPDSVALTTLEKRLETYTLKEAVDVVLSGEVEVNITSFSPIDLFNIERSSRDLQTRGDTLALYVVYLPGTLEENRNSLAVSYLGGSIAVFKEVIRRVARQAAGVSARDIETSAVVHELGHLFGLVNIVYQSDLDYEDPEHPFHSLNQSCVMYWAIEVGPFLTETPPVDFGFEARHDIEKLRSGGYETFPSRLRESEAMGLMVAWSLVEPPVVNERSPIFLCRVEVAS
jgi:predicted Zn-dependent protease with MMP-like domain